MEDVEDVLNCLEKLPEDSAVCGSLQEETERADTHKLPLLGRLSSFWNTQTQRLRQLSEVGFTCRTLTGPRGGAVALRRC